MYARPPSETYLVDFGTVLERLRIVGVVHQTDHVAGQVRLGQEVEVWHHLVELGEETREEEGGKKKRRTKMKYTKQQ